MQQWTWSAAIGVGFGLLVLAAIFVPVLVVQQRRYGGLDARRILGAAALAVYGVTLAAYTLLPLPGGDLAAWCAAHGIDGAELVPFHSLADIRQGTAGLSLAAALRSTVVLQVVFNVLLFVPWGVLARRYLGWGVLASTASALAASATIELTQFTGIFGAIGCSYRVADVDDLLTNTLGGLLGALVAPVVLRWMPQSRTLRGHRLEPRPVTVWRRWLGMAVDVFAVLTLGVVLELGLRVATLLLSGEMPGARGWPDVLAGAVVPVLLVLLLPPWWGSGASLGQRAVWLEPRWPDGAGGLVRGTLGRRVARGYVTLGLYGFLQIAAAAPGGGGGARFVSSVLVLAVGIGVLVTRDRRGLSCVATGARMVDARTPSPVAGSSTPGTPPRTRPTARSAG